MSDQNTLPVDIRSSLTGQPYHPRGMGTLSIILWVWGTSSVLVLAYGLQQHYRARGLLTTVRPHRFAGLPPYVANRMPA